MKKGLLSIALIGALTLGLPSVAWSKSAKRGVSENSFQYVDQIEGLSPGVCWYYNWGNSEGAAVDGQDYMEYLPMCWNGGYNANTIREYCNTHPTTKFLLGFNEPNFKAQSNMTPTQAAEAWPGVQALARELGLKLVAPVLNYSPDAPYTDPTKWMDEFVALVGGDAFDYTAIHSYGGFGVLKDLATTFYERYGKDVWVTEFCYWPGESGYVAPATQIASMVETLEWLEKTDWIYRYAWFKAIGQSESKNTANYGLIVSAKKDEYQGNLSEQGKVYVYLNDFDPDVYHPVNQPIAATDYISRTMASLGASKDAASVKPIEISQFNSGATLDYQFDVPAAGEYKLVLRVSGMGDPVRFNPNLGVVRVKEDGSDGDVLTENRQFSLSNDDEIYEEVSFPMYLNAGRQTIRLKDYAPYQPSGIRISTVALAEAAGVGELTAEDFNRDVNVYNLQGVCVLKGVNRNELHGALPQGIYIVDGKKILVR